MSDAARVIDIGSS